jgi:NHLM bacteriocin system ABC transporter ATP-binding protein
VNRSLLNANSRKELNNEDEIWVVEEGRGDIFIESGGGPLIYFASVEKGELVFGFRKVEGISILLVAEHTMELRRVDLYAFIEENDDNGMKRLLDWIHRFDPFFSKFRKDKIDYFVDPGKDLHLKAGLRVAAARSRFPEFKNEIRWALFEKGALYLFNMKEYAFHSTLPVPLCQASWMESDQDLELHFISTEEALKKEAFLSSLKLLHEYYLRLRKEDIQTIEKKESEDTKLRQALDENMLTRSLKKMGGVLGKEEAWGFSALSDPVYKAMHILGEKLYVQFLEPKELATLTNDFEKIELICRFSKVGYRRVKLTSGWWKEDCLPLLGFYGAEERPVALINRKGGDYLMIDPETGTKTKVNDEIASHLSEAGFSFYPPFREKKISGKSIIAFSIGQYKNEIASLLSIGIFGALLSLIPPLLNEWLFNKVIRPYDNTLLAQIIWGMVIATVSIGIFQFVRSFAVLRLLQLVDVKLEPAFWARVLSLPASFFRQFTVGNLVQRVFAVSEIRQLIGGNVIRVVFAGIFSLFYFIAMLYYSFQLAFIGLGLIVVGFLLSLYCIYFKIKIERRIQAVEGTLRGTIVQLVTGVSKLRVNGAEARAFAYWADDFAEFQNLTYRSSNYDTIVTSVLAALPILTTGVMFVVLVGHQPTISLGAFIAFLAAYVPFSMAVYDAINTTKALIPIIPLWERARVVIETEPESEVQKEKPGKLTGELSVDHVYFQYEKDGPQILEGVSFFAHPGEFVALVGPSGSGKSTLVRLLLGFDTPSQGGVYYDGKNVNKLDLLEVRRQIGTVLQNGAIISGSIYENIVSGGLYTQEEVMEAIRLSGFDKDLMNFPMGLQTVVQSGGGTLSVGQGQRLLISRALISKPKILIFDEATSALDNKTQDEVSKRLEEIEVTRIVIAHRLSTIRNANRIYVVNKGRIAQSGSFLELAQQEGIFAEMLKRQML